MNDADIESKVLDLFLAIAPDVDSAKLERTVPFRQQFDFDSMDTLNFAISLSESFHIEVPETDYRELASLAKTVKYVSRKVAVAS
jgi:acyl carrier protein